MQDLTYTALNEFLVGAFNEILRIEGRVLCRGPFQNLSIREVHVIEAVAKRIHREIAGQALSPLFSALLPAA